MADSVSLWKPEPNVVLHQALGKACEESTELAGILARCMIQGFDASEPVTGKSNRQALFEEVADVDAAIQWVRELVPDEYDAARADRKLRGYRRWQRMLEESQAADRAQMLRMIEGVLNIPSAGDASAGELAETILDALGFVDGSTK